MFLREEGKYKIIMEPKYKAIYSYTKEKILKGEYPVGQAIPDELSVCAQFHCSRMTVKKAYDMLASEGFIYRRQGQGSFVLPRGGFPVPPENIVERGFRGFSRAFPNIPIHTKVLRFDLIFANEKIAQHLNISPQEAVYDIERVRYAYDRPYCLEHTYMPVSLIPGITEEILHRSVYNHIEHTLNMHIDAAHRISSAARSTEKDQKELWLKDVEPVLVVEQVVYLDNGKPFEYSITHHRYDLYQICDYITRDAKGEQ